MHVRITSGPIGVEDALFGLGLSYGVTSGRSFNTFRTSKEFNQTADVAKKLAHQQGGHNKFLETIVLWLDITAPRYWWQEFDTYRVGITKQSESTMHTIMQRPLDERDFEEGFYDEVIVKRLNRYIAELKEDKDAFMKVKSYLPEGYLQRRIISVNCKTLQNMWYQRRNHKLKEWRQLFISIVDALEVHPYADLVRYFLFSNEYTRI